jgi:acetyltransferase AlgX (SGNH hydrolase-like protein)
MERFRATWQPGFLIPLVLGVVFATDVSLHALRRDRVSYRVWEALRTFGAETPFRSGARYDRPRVYGNLAALGNQPSLRDYHRIVFTTDAWGYHNPPLPADGSAVSAILFGSSFAAGTEVCDSEGLAAQLSALTGRPVYNAAPAEPAPPRVRSLAQRLGMVGGVVIFEYFEGGEPPPISALIAQGQVQRCRRSLGAWDTPLTCRALNWLSEQLDVSPLQVFAARLYRRVQDDRFLPNVGAARLIRAPLRNGPEVLFLADERTIFHRARDPGRAERYFSWLAEQVALQGHQLLVVLSPQKYSVYAPLLREPDPGPEASLAYLREIERRLGTRRIPVVNLTDPLRAAAREALAHDSLVYWRDDTHWNAAGNAVSARAIAPALFSALARGASSGRR